MTTTAAPYFLHFLALSKKSCSPSFSEIEFTIHLPCVHFSPASMTAKFDESIQSGTREISGSEESRLMNFAMIACPSIMPSSMFKSRICAPDSTCTLATCSAASNRFSFNRRRNCRLPATLHRSPILTKFVYREMQNGSRPTRHHASIGFERSEHT
jgi:hypothetical protein